MTPFEQAIPHSPLGAHASFDFGPPATRAGFAQPPGEPYGHDVFVGFRASPVEPWRLLPTFTPTAQGPQPLPKGRFGRFFSAAGDKWMIGPLVFKLCTPLPLDAADDDAFRHAPVVCGYLEYENTHSEEPVELVFAIGTAGERCATAVGRGFIFRGDCACATAASDEVDQPEPTAVFGPAAGALCALRFTVPALSRRLYPLVLGFHRPGYHYTRFFPHLGAVLTHGLAEHARYLAASDRQDAAFMRSPLDPAMKARTAEELRRWLAASRRRDAEPEIDLAPLRELWRRVTG